MRSAIVLARLAACWRSPTSQPRAAERSVRHDVSLSIDRNPAGALAIDRDGSQCDGHQLSV